MYCCERTPPLPPAPRAPFSIHSRNRWIKAPKPAAADSAFDCGACPAALAVQKKCKPAVPHREAAASPPLRLVIDVATVLRPTPLLICQAAALAKTPTCCGAVTAGSDSARRAGGHCANQSALLSGLLGLFHPTGTAYVVLLKRCFARRISWINDSSQAGPIKLLVLRLHKGGMQFDLHI